MKILALVTDAYGGDGGIARFNRDLLGALAAIPEVERIDVLSRHPRRRDEPAPAKLTQASVAGGRVGYALSALARAVFGMRYDIVLCGHLHLATVAALVARLQDIPLWIQTYGFEAWQRPGPLRARATLRAELVTSISRYTRARFLEWAHVAHHRVRVLPCTFQARFTPGPRPAELAKRLGFNGRRVLLTVSRVDQGDRYKGHDTVLAALQRLAAHRPELTYAVVGDGDDRPRLEQLARDLGLAERVHFAGQVSDSDLAEFYRLSDVFVMPSAKEGFGIVFLEAAAAGLPVIGGSLDGSADPLADGAIGALVTPGDVAALVAAIEAALLAPRPDPRRGARFAETAFQQHAQALLRELVARQGASA